MQKFTEQKMFQNNFNEMVCKNKILIEIPFQSNNIVDRGIFFDGKCY